jgi:transposase-like protein
LSQRLRRKANTLVYNLRRKINCPICKNVSKKFGRDRKGKQRYRCGTCGRTFQRLRTNILGGKLIPQGKALAVLQHLVEGCSVRARERLTQVHRDTVLRLLQVAARKCEALMLQQIRELPVKHVECDELWSFIGMKAKTKGRNSRHRIPWLCHRHSTLQSSGWT